MFHIQLYIYTFKLLRGRCAELTFLLSDRVQEDQKVQEEECTNLDQIDCLISHWPWFSTQKDHFHCKHLCIEGVCTRVHDHGTSSRPPVAAENTCKIMKTPAKCVVLSAVFALNFEHRRLLLVHNGELYCCCWCWSKKLLTTLPLAQWARVILHI